MITELWAQNGNDTPKLISEPVVRKMLCRYYETSTALHVTDCWHSISNVAAVTITNVSVLCNIYPWVNVTAKHSSTGKRMYIGITANYDPGQVLRVTPFVAASVRRHCHYARKV